MFIVPLSHRLSLVHLPTAHLSTADINLRRILNKQQAAIMIKPASMIVASTTAMHVVKLTSMAFCFHLTCRQIETDITRKERASVNLMLCKEPRPQQPAEQLSHQPVERIDATGTQEQKCVTHNRKRARVDQPTCSIISSWAALE